ncbi:hypothetical protein B0H34DRAFT_679538 [Crassisporium funariophilum]|nr:hypothetical protein B0H34DRAFT_679538 [Crassisporium funariophilum]
MEQKAISPGTLYLLLQACQELARKVAGSYLFITVYDNINMMIRIAKQILGRKNAQENGTCATVIPLHNAKLEDIETKLLDNGIINAPPLRLENLLLTSEESELMEQALVLTSHWNDELRENVPKSTETIVAHQTSLHPLPSMEIDKNTITGNIEIIEEMNAELKLMTENPDHQKYLKFIAGDQLTIAQQRVITGIRLGHKVGTNMWKHFHSSDRDLIMVSLYAWTLHCLLMILGEEDLESYAKNVMSWDTMKNHAQEILETCKH